VVAVIIEATEAISKSLSQYLNNIRGKHEIKELQKNSRIGHCTHTVESAYVEVQNIFYVRKNTACSTNCKYRRETWFVSDI
jgi:NADPH-dependent 7-cyano-7-deazaguanine reductase QueF